MSDQMSELLQAFSDEMTALALEYVSASGQPIPSGGRLAAPFLAAAWRSVATIDGDTPMVRAAFATMLREWADGIEPVD